jgi:hypothetical protein
MAIESQGIQIRRQGTAVSDTAHIVNTSLQVAATVITQTAANGFIVSGFSSGMRVMVSGGTQNAGQVFTVKSLTSVALNIYAPSGATAEDATGLTLTGEAYYPIGEVTGFNGPTGSANVIDVTNLGSTAKEKMIGIRDEGQVSISVNVNASADQYQLALKNDRAARSLRKFDITFTDQATALAHIPSAINFDAYVTGFAITGSVDNAVKGTITLEITSAVKWIAKAS